MNEKEKQIALRVAQTLPNLIPDEDVIAFASKFLDAIRAESEPVAKIQTGSNGSTAVDLNAILSLPIGTLLYTTPPRVTCPTCTQRIDEAANGKQIKGHQIAELVNKLRYIAVKYHDHQSLRDRLAGPVHDLWESSNPAPVDGQSKTGLTATQADAPALDLNVCPGCGGEADNGNDRSYPPTPYFCTKCVEDEK